MLFRSALYWGFYFNCGLPSAIKSNDQLPIDGVMDYHGVLNSHIVEKARLLSCGFKIGLTLPVKSTGASVSDLIEKDTIAIFPEPQIVEIIVEKIVIDTVVPVKEDIESVANEIKLLAEWKDFTRQFAQQNESLLHYLN